MMTELQSTIQDFEAMLRERQQKEQEMTNEATTQVNEFWTECPILTDNAEQFLGNIDIPNTNIKMGSSIGPSDWLKFQRNRHLKEPNSNQGYLESRLRTHIETAGALKAKHQALVPLSCGYCGQLNYKESACWIKAKKCLRCGDVGIKLEIAQDGGKRKNQM